MSERKHDFVILWPGTALQHAPPRLRIDREVVPGFVSVFVRTDGHSPVALLGHKLSTRVPAANKE